MSKKPPISKYLRNPVVLGLLLALAFLTAERGGHCCSRPAPPPLTRFDTSSYVFIGEVIDAVGPMTSDAVFGEAWGLRIRVTDEVFLPRKPAQFFEVFEYFLTSHCQAGGMDRDRALAFFPIGSVVRVIAWESTRLESVLPNRNLRLDGRPFNQRAIISLVLDDEPVPATSTSIFSRTWHRRCRRWHR
jgi:hypothetical protein